MTSVISFLVAFLLIFSANLHSRADTGKSDTEKPSKEKEGDRSDKSSEEEPGKPLKIGNLALPVSQQPSPLLSFGQNIIDAHQTQMLVLSNEFKGNHQYFINVIPSILYAFTDSFSIFITAPFAARYRQDHHHSSGGEDLIIQLEYAYYTKEAYTYIDQATLVTSVTIPTGSTKKNPPTGLGANSFFIGGTYSREGIYWFYFTSHGALLTGSSHRTKFGNQFLYQFGVGRNIANVDDWLFAWMVELDGIYSWKDRIRGSTDPNSGGNVIFLTPSLWISSTHCILQLGIGCPVQQHLFGHQTKNDYLLALNAGWTF
jgi:hypothetical protein